MKSGSRYGRLAGGTPAFPVIALLLSLCTTTAAQKVVTPEAKGSVTGRVSSAGKGVAGCLVLLWKGPSQSPVFGATLTAKTKDDGSFRISAAAGSYYAWIMAPGFFVVVDGKPSQQLRPWALTAGQNTDGLNFEIQRGAALTGKVTSADSKPVIESRVFLLSDKPVPERPFATSTLENWTTVRTDDRGVYRFFGIPPGIYRVAAGEEISAYASMVGKPAIKRTFYPDEVEQAKGKTVSLNAGDEVSGIDIRMPLPELVFSVSGTVIDEFTGKPVGGVSLGMNIYSREKQIGGRGWSEHSNSKGEFKVENVPVGRYSLVSPSNPNWSDIQSDFFGESQIFDVADGDVEGIVIKVVRTAAISGFVILEGPDDKSLLKALQNLRFFVTSLPKQGLISFKQLTIAQDGTFAVNGLQPGKLNFNIQGVSPFKIARVEHNDSFEPIEIKGGDTIGGLKVVLVEATGSVRGSIKLANGESANKLKGTAGLYNGKDIAGYVLVDEQGRFVIENVPAGTYRLIVNASIPGMKPAHQEQPITVTNGQVSEAVVTLSATDTAP